MVDMGGRGHPGGLVIRYLDLMRARGRHKGVLSRRHEARGRIAAYLCNWPLSQTAWITALVIGTWTGWSVVVSIAKSLGYVWTMPLAPLTL